MANQSGQREDEKCLQRSRYGCQCLLNVGHQGDHDPKCGWGDHKFTNPSKPLPVEGDQCRKCHQPIVFDVKLGWCLRSGNYGKSSTCIDHDPELPVERPELPALKNDVFTSGNENNAAASMWEDRAEKILGEDWQVSRLVAWWLEQRNSQLLAAQSRIAQLTQERDAVQDLLGMSERGVSGITRILAERDQLKARLAEVRK